MSTKTSKPGHSKKHLRESIALQLHTALVTFKAMVNEKKLHKLVKKASKLLADGLHHPKPVVAAAKKKTVNKKPALKKVAPQKAAVKKATVKKTIKKKK